MNRTYLSLGSNIGDRLNFLKRAIVILEEHASNSNIRVSSFYETEPQGVKDQADFLNCVVEMDTDLDPYELLELCQGIERELKRVRLLRWGPRTIDVDILTYGDIIINEDDLVIPHKYMYQRAFVLIPLAELNRDFNKYLESVKNQEVRKFIV